MAVLAASHVYHQNKIINNQTLEYEMIPNYDCMLSIFIIVIGRVFKIVQENIPNYFLQATALLWDANLQNSRYMIIYKHQNKH